MLCGVNTTLVATLVVMVAEWYEVTIRGTVFDSILSLEAVLLLVSYKPRAWVNKDRFVQHNAFCWCDCCLGCVEVEVVSNL